MVLIPASSFSNWSELQMTDFLSSPGLYNCSTPSFFLWVSQIALNSTCPRSSLYPDIPQPDAPVIYTGAFPILTAWPGSVCYIRCNSGRPGFNPRSSHTKDWYLIPPYLTHNIIRYVSRVKWTNPGKGVAPSPTPRCSSYWKGSLQVTPGYSR